MQKIKKISIILLAILVLFLIIVPQVYAAGPNKPQPYNSSSTSSSKDAIENPDSFKPDVVGGNDKFMDIGNVIVGIIKTLGIVISVVISAIVGIKYMLGSVYEKAEYKKTMLPYLVGAVMLFAGSFIVDIIYRMSLDT